ncbi:adenylosuccinate lyase [candidate division WOR-3 bacterium]|nr:adenylosuccinate lyase [candidate division WOR-3 bacterium]
MSLLDRYTLPEMKELWSEDNKFRTWLKVEIAACRARMEKGLIPKEEFNVIEEKAGFDLNRIREIENEVQHDVIAFLSSVSEKVGEPSRHIHFGMTSSDVLDTAQALILIEAGNIILKSLESLIEKTKIKALETKHLVMMGRTHGVHAEPVTLGVKLLSHRENFKRSLKILKEATENVRYGKISGPVGIYGNLDPSLEERTLDILGLKTEPVATQVVPRDRHLYFVMALAHLAAALERTALQIRLLQRTETAELGEPFSVGQKGSSAMPHKKNPVICERICGLARLFRGYTSASLENVSLWDERDISHSSVERIVLPQATSILLYMLRKMEYIIENLSTDAGRMKQNKEKSGQRYLSGAFLLKLCEKGVNRDEAYRIIQSAALKAQENGISLSEILEKDKAFSGFFTIEEIRRTADEDKFIENVDLIFKRILDSEKEE